MSNPIGGRTAILFILVGGLGVGSLAYYVKSTPEARRVPDEVRVPPKPKKTEAPVEATVRPDRPQTVEKTKPVETDVVRLPVFGDEISDKELAKTETPVPGGGDAMKYVASRIVEAAHFDGTRVLDVQVRDHVAFVSFNETVESGMGSMQEGAFLRAFQIGFGQFTDVDKVALEVGGQPLESGHVDLSAPLPVIRPGEKSAPEPEPTFVEP